MHVNFLLGPAGSGKTCYCLQEICAELKAAPAGAPLLFLAPRQATFQLECALLSDPDLPGYTRLKIVSFDKLAELILDQFGSRALKVLSEEGRVMVLRALLQRRSSELQLFQTSARLPAFAQELSKMLQELQHHQLTPKRLLQLSAETAGAPHLPAKLHDLALLLGGYLEWLQENELQDSANLLGLAAETVKQTIPRGDFQIAGLWLDGLAELTPQELDLLAALVPACRRVCLAFCLDRRPEKGSEWHSMWSAIGQTFWRCYHRLEMLAGCKIEVTELGRQASRGRFAANPMLAHLEQHWSVPVPFPTAAPGAPTGKEETRHPASDSLASSLQVCACPNPELEAVVAAREILRHVRERGGRFREVAVLVRSLDTYHQVLRRVFTRYEIPFFLDRRESMAHHPLAELTRYALRTVARGWEHEDWFGALKTGLVAPGKALLIDWLENIALAHGWNGSACWQQPLEFEDKAGMLPQLEQLRQELVPAFQNLAMALVGRGVPAEPQIGIQLHGSAETPRPTNLQGSKRQPTGPQLAAALRQFWDELRVPETLDAWGQPGAPTPEALWEAELHEAVRQEIERWLESLELAFAKVSLPVNDWLGVVDAGLTSLSVGIIPPALDQVLVGAVDRSRNPDLQTILILGLNEMVFPAVPPPPLLLTEQDRTVLASGGVVLGLNQREQVAQERFLGYIACTRARQRVVLTYAQRDIKDKPLNPSLFLDHLQRLFPALSIRTIPLPLNWREALHAQELVPPLLGARLASASSSAGLQKVAHWPMFAPVLARWDQIAKARQVAGLSAGGAEKLYGPNLLTSISDLEEYAACPFKFFVRRGLKAQERQEFEIDARERGSFQHEALMKFHRRLQAQRRQWRDVSPGEARDLVGEIGRDLQATFRKGLFCHSPERNFIAGLLIQNLQDCVEVLVGWARDYQFDPWVVEISFGEAQDKLLAWTRDLGGGHSLALRGRIDRVDIHPRPDGAADVVVIDYKAGGQELEEIKLNNGLDLQLLAYLSVLRDNPRVQELFGATKLFPAGAFYVGLRTKGGSRKNREEALANAAQARKKFYQHRGRFNGELLRIFDQQDRDKGEQFRYFVKTDGEFGQKNNEALPAAEFAGLVEQVENFLCQFGRGIYAGTVKAEPYRIKKKTPCDFCEYGPVCRFDPWLQPFRILKKEGPVDSEPAAGGPG